MTPYYSDPLVTIYLGDCRKLMPSIDLSGVSCVIADPPYAETSLEWDRWPALGGTNEWSNLHDLGEEARELAEQLSSEVEGLRQKLDGVCSRCHRLIADFAPPNGGMTAGYYVAAAWEKYANPGEVYICDACIWDDPRYIADYGPVYTA